MIVCEIRNAILPGTIIPRPLSKKAFVIKTWGHRRGERALIYFIPNNRDNNRPYEKGIAESEFEQAYRELMKRGRFTHSWFNENLRRCAKEGPCNFTLIGGVFEILKLSKYVKKGIYERCSVQ